MSEWRFGPVLRQKIEEKIAGFRHRETEAGMLENRKQAAVAIIVVPDTQGEAQFVLTRRTPKLRTHAGQWALPGGRLDAGETVIEAVLREVFEELGIKVAADRVLGCLDAYPTRSGYLITPVVLWCEDLEEFRPNPDEVASVHTFGLAELRREDSPVFLKIEESDRPVLRVLLGESHVHAPTAALLYQFSEVALAGRSTRVHLLEQPVWAWK